MGHRALIAYQRPDQKYNIHYSHWGASNLQLKHAITAATPFGSDQPATTARETYEHFQGAETVDRSAFQTKSKASPVDQEPRAVGVSFDELLTEHLDYLSHEALYVVETDFEVTAYRTHWFGLTYDADSVSDAPTVGNGVIRTVRWHNGQPVGDGFTQGQFEALRAVVGELVDRGVFGCCGAQQFMRMRLREWTGPDQSFHVRLPTDGPV